MDVFLLHFSVAVTILTSEIRSETNMATCDDLDEEFYRLIEGEAFYYLPYMLEHNNYPDEDFAWYKTGSKVENITTNEKERIHYHGGALFLLNITAADSGIYTAMQTTPSGSCENHFLNVEVFSGSNREKLNFGVIENSDMNKMVPCPEPVKNTCRTFQGSYTWYKDDHLLPGKHKMDLWINKATKDDEGIYVCVCTWTHNHRMYRSSGSRRLKNLDVERHQVEILSPSNKEQFADEGYSITLNCTVYCGTNVKECKAEWRLNGSSLNHTKGYHQANKMVIEESSKNSISSDILTIEKTSTEDFQHQFECVGVGFYGKKSFTLSLKRRETAIPLVIGGVCVVLICIFAAVLIKCFAIDLALLFRPYFLLGRHDKDAKMYDAFVVYQTQNMDRATDDKLCHFITKTLPSVLEDKCGYRLFIQGRDDIPGEDRLEQVESCIKQSRRLMVILTPGSGSGSEIPDKHLASPSTSVFGEFDWQVGLHHALVQREMSVILIQMGDLGPQGYTHLPPGLQHLIRESAPIRWPDGSQGAASWKSHFWKRVRYLMPITPVKKCALSSIM